VTLAVLGPGGVGGFLAGALARAGEPVLVVAREETAAVIQEEGLQIESVRLGTFTTYPATSTALDVEAEVLLVATKAPALEAALERVRTPPRLVVPLLNGVEHLPRLRERFAGTPATVVAGSIRIAAERVAPGLVVHTSPLFRVDLAPHGPADALAHRLRAAEVPARVVDTEAEVLWSKLARLAPLALATAATGEPIGAVLAHPLHRETLRAAVSEVAAVAGAEGVPVDRERVLGELAALDPGQRSSLARDVLAGGPTELDAIGGAVLRAAARHGLPATAVGALVHAVAERVR
jgi:2-dehydropantoate 2-reductase